MEHCNSLRTFLSETLGSQFKHVTAAKIVIFVSATVISSIVPQSLLVAP